MSRIYNVNPGSIDNPLDCLYNWKIHQALLGFFRKTEIHQLPLFVRIGMVILYGSVAIDSPWDDPPFFSPKTGDAIPSGYVQIAIENCHRNSGFSH